MITFVTANAKHRKYATISLEEAYIFALEFGGYIDRLNGHYVIVLMDGLRFTDSEKAKLYNFLYFNLN